MTVPMILLAVGSVAAGAYSRSAPPCSTGWNRSSAPTTASPPCPCGRSPHSHWWWCSQESRWPTGSTPGSRSPEVAPAKVTAFTAAARKDLYGDAFNEAALMRPGQELTRTLVTVDGRGVDGAVNGFAALVGGTSMRVRRLQTGFVRSYALFMFAGAALLVATMLVRLW